MPIGASSSSRLLPQVLVVCAGLLLGVSSFGADDPFRGPRCRHMRGARLDLDAPADASHEGGHISPAEHVIVTELLLDSESGQIDERGTAVAAHAATPAIPPAETEALIPLPAASPRTFTVLAALGRAPPCF